jgi:hypothetical protein
MSLRKPRWIHSRGTPLSLLLGFLAFSLPSPGYASLLARCGGSQGKALFFGAGETSWSDDPLSKGQFLFVTDAKGNPSILFYDATGLMRDVSDEGGKVAFTFLHSHSLSFGVVVTYQEGIVETYNVIHNPAGSTKLLWTVNRSGEGGTTKVGAYEADCTLGR